MRLRLVRLDAGTRSVAVQRDEVWVPLAALPGSEQLGSARSDLLALLGGGPELLAFAGKLVDAYRGSRNAVQELGGLPFHPTGFRDCSLWESHLVDSARALLQLRGGVLARVATGYERLAGRPFPPLRPRPLWYESPLFYTGTAAGCIGDGDTVPWPAYTQALDYELEIGLLVANEVRDASPEEAMDAVGGFMLVNDVSARDVQYREIVEGRMGPGKSKDFATVLGPTVVTPDELMPLLGGLTAEVWCGGRLVATGCAAGMRHSVAEVVSYASAGGRLMAGEVISLGTVPGCSGLESGAWVSPGDVLDLRAGPLGGLRNVIGEPEPSRRAAGKLPRARWSVVCRSGEEPDPRGVLAASWRPPPVPPLTGALSPNTLLDTVECLPLAGGDKPEDVVVDGAGRLYTGVEDGRIYRWPADPAADTVPELFADTHGRPLGLEIDPRDGSLVVCDAYRGLLRVSGGKVAVMADTYEGRRLRFANNAAVARDGTIYFSDTSTRFRIDHWKHDLLEHRPNGRIFRYRPSSEELTLCADGLYFPNGVSLTPDESALLLLESGTYQLSRIELVGAASGRRRMLTALPGFPDNLSPVGDDTYWVAVPSLRLPVFDRMLPVPLARRVVARAPSRLQPAAVRYGLVVQVDGSGRILRSLHGPAGRYAEITGVRQHNGWLYLGSLVESSVARVRLPA